MKHRILCSTKWFYFLTELPLIAMFAVTLYFNGTAKGGLKFVPMLCAFAALIIFVFIFFFRLVVFSYDEVRTVGRFSSRDKVALARGKELRITLLRKRRLRIEIIGNDGDAPALDWLKDEAPSDFCQLRAKAVGGKRAACRILSLYGVDALDEALFLPDAEPCTKDTPAGTLRAMTELECRTLSLTFAVTFDIDGTVIPEDEDSPKDDAKNETQSDGNADATADVQDDVQDDAC